MKMQYFEVWGLIDFDYGDIEEGTTYFRGRIAELKKGKYFIAEEDRKLFLVDAPTKEDAIIKAALDCFSDSDYNIIEIKSKQVKICKDVEDLAIENYLDITVIKEE